MACVASGRSIRKERAEEHSGATVEARDAARNAADCIDGGVGAAAGGRPDTTRRAGLPGRYPTVLDRDKRIANTVAPAPKPGPSPAAANWQESWEIDPGSGAGATILGLARNAVRPEGVRTKGKRARDLDGRAPAGCGLGTGG